MSPIEQMMAGWIFASVICFIADILYEIKVKAEKPKSKE